MIQDLIATNYNSDKEYIYNYDYSGNDGNYYLESSKALVFAELSVRSNQISDSLEALKDKTKIDRLGIPSMFLWGILTECGLQKSIRSQ